MRELIIFVPSIEDGGVEKNLFLIANYISSKGVKTNIITANFDKKYKFKKNINFISPKSDFLNKKNRFYKTVYCFFSLLYFCLKNRNVLIMSFQANIYAIFFAYLFQIKIITRSNTAPQGWSNNYLKRLIFKVFFKYPKKIIVNSLEFKKSIDREFKINSECIYNPFDKHVIKEKKNQKIKFLFFQKDKKNTKFINIGRMTEQKDQILILKAFNSLKKDFNFKLIILGKGKNKLELLNFITKNKLNKKVKILGYKKNPYPYLNMSDVFILSSKFEGLPNVLIEAQYLNKLIISTNCPTGPKEILCNGKAGLLFNVGSKFQLIKKIKFACNKKNIGLIKNKKKIGFTQIKRFDYDKNINKYFKLVKKYL